MEAIKLMTVGRHIMETQRQFPEATGRLSKLLMDIAFAGKVIGRIVRRAGLADILGLTSDINIQGEQVAKLDSYSNEVLIRILQGTGLVGAIASEELDTEIIEKDPLHMGDYVVMFDPLDGSSNIDVNASIGTIFAIHKRVNWEQNGPLSLKDILQPGFRIVGAGYIIYGSSTMLVYSTGTGVHGFTYAPSIGEFLLSHPFIKTPERGKILSVNEGNYHKWKSDAYRKYVDHLKMYDPEHGHPYTARYIGALVADFHRNMLRGGIFLYPPNTDKPAGKLRLLYEAAPLSYLQEHAGGLATDGKGRILDIWPEQLHQRTPLFIGSKLDMEELQEFIDKYGL